MENTCGNYGISFGCEEETMEAKARWFKSLTPEQRIEQLGEFYDFIMEINPSIFEKRFAETLDKNIRILEKK